MLNGAPTPQAEPALLASCGRRPLTMGSRPPAATRQLYCSLPNRAARMKYRRCNESEVLTGGPGGDGASSSLRLEATESSMSLAPLLPGQQVTSLPLKEEPVSGHHDQTEAPVLGGEDGRCDDEIMPQCNDLSSRMTDYCFEPLAIPGGASFEGDFSFHDLTMGDVWNGVDAGPSYRVTQGPMGAPAFLSCPENAEGEKPADSPTAGYLRSSDIQPASAVTWTNYDNAQPASDREYDNEDDDDEEEPSSDDDDMPAHRSRIAGSVASKVTFKRQAVRPGNQADLARNRQLRLEASRARRNLAATQLITDDAVFLAPRSSLPVGELLSKMEKLALGRAVRSSRFTHNPKRF
ncbi:hypothetical protein MTO96_012828 [Rhipicephalus appendiculatus]